MKKKVFGASFDPNKQPGCESRLGNASLDKFFGDGKISFPSEKVDMHGMDLNPVDKFKTQTLLKANTPSVILRRKGQKV